MRDARTPAVEASASGNEEVTPSPGQDTRNGLNWKRFACEQTSSGIASDGGHERASRHLAFFQSTDIAAVLNQLVSTTAQYQRQVEVTDISGSSARLPLGDRPDVGNLTALVSPGIDRPELVGLAVLDHCRIVRTLVP